ncbi:MAG: metallophosphoesterase [Planctomycetes bacterium]|nr:metallophosphoesterase [Planctomycetota bacterium]
MRRANLIAGALGTACFVSLLTSACCSVLPTIPSGTELRCDPAHGRFIIYGDTRGAMPLECLIRPVDFDTERTLVTKRLLEERPDFILNSGDLVGRGSSETQWERDWDRPMTPLRDAGIPLYMAWGNHEYWMDPGEAARHIEKRFPQLGGRHWYSLRYGRILVIVLDSNLEQVGPKHAAAQDAWLDDTIASADADASLKTIILVGHHSPYTNSTIHDPHEESQRRFVARAGASQKTRVYVSGHVHNYERFSIDGIQFVVAGGGGAPSTKVNVRSPRFKDEFQGPEIRPFQYCLFRVEPDRITVDVMMLGNDGTWYRGDGFTVE